MPLGCVPLGISSVGARLLDILVSVVSHTLRPHGVYHDKVALWRHMTWRRAIVTCTWASAASNRAEENGRLL